MPFPHLSCLETPMHVLRMSSTSPSSRKPQTGSNKTWRAMQTKLKSLAFSSYQFFLYSPLYLDMFWAYLYHHISKLFYIIVSHVWPTTKQCVPWGKKLHLIYLLSNHLILYSTHSRFVNINLENKATNEVWEDTLYYFPHTSWRLRTWKLSLVLGFVNYKS